MGHVAGAAVGGAALGIGSYYAYQRYKSWDRSRSQTWCSYRGAYYDCQSCRERYGWSQCREDNSCFEPGRGGGCGYTLPNDVNRDDLMTTGFLPKTFTPPLLVTVKKIEGYGLTQADLKCDATANELAAKG